MLESASSDPVPTAVADRLDIQDLIARYGRAVDQRDWDVLDRIFTVDCHIDYTAMGGIAGDLPTIKEYLAKTMPIFVRTQHMMGLPVIDLDGDRATAATICHNPMVVKDGDDPQLMVCGLWYHERFVRTAQGWRIEQLTEERCYIKILKGKAN
jgi:hypothetical protein